MKYIGIEYIYHKCGGLGDRLCGLVNIIMLSEIIKKKFFIKWDEKDNINQYLNYEKYDFYKMNLNKLKNIKKNFLDNKDLNLINILNKIKNINDFDKFLKNKTDYILLEKEEDIISIIKDVKKNKKKYDSIRNNDYKKVVDNINCHKFGEEIINKLK